jgi:hypothetical protein
MTLREILNSAGIEYTVADGWIKSKDLCLTYEWLKLADTGDAQFNQVGTASDGPVYESPDSEIVVSVWKGSVSITINRPDDFRPLGKPYQIGTYSNRTFENDTLGSDPELTAFETLDDAIASIRAIYDSTTHPRSLESFGDAAVQDAEGRIVWWLWHDGWPSSKTE